MASIPMDRNGKAKARRSAARPSASAHPAFPAVVALWFAALFGIGSLIVPVALIESALGATGIAAFVPAAAPPLGFTARSLIAVVATVAGGLLGLVAARRVAAASGRTTAPASHGELAPLDDEDDDDFASFLSADDDFDEPASAPRETEPKAKVAGRRRALAMEEESGPSDFLNAAPLPGGQMLASPLRKKAEPEFDPDVEQPLELGEELVADEPKRQEFMPAGESDPIDDTPVVAEPVAFKPTPAPLPFSPPSLSRDTVERHESAEPEPTVEASDEAAPQPRQVFQPVAPEAQPGEDPDSMSENPVTEHRPFDIPSAAPAPAPFAEDEVAAFDAEEDVADEDFAEDEPAEQGEGLVQLVQKLGSALEKHREWSAQRSAPPPAMPAPFAQPVEDAQPTPVPTAFEAAAPDDAAEAMKAFFGAPDGDDANQASAASEEEAPAKPMAWQPVENYRAVGGLGSVSRSEDEDEDEIDDLAATFSLPIKSTPAPAPAAAPAPSPTPRPSFDIPPSAPQAEAPSSYDAIAADNPFKANRQEFVRIEDEPVDDVAQPAVVFPNDQARAFDRPAGAERAAKSQPSPSNDDSDRALREALLNLQRMGK